MKKITLAIATILLAGTAITVSSCGKYEDGPSVSLLTKKMRLTGDWDAKSYTDADGNTVADNDEDDFVTFEKDGTYSATAVGNSGSITQTGQWAFSSDKEKLIRGYTFGSTTINEEYTILRLTNKELWLKDSDGNTSKAEKL